MDKQRILDELLRLLESAGVQLRSEPLGGSGGGLCTVKGCKVFFVDTQAGPADMAAQCAQAVCDVLDVEKVYMRPEVRQFVENSTRRTRL